MKKYFLLVFGIFLSQFIFAGNSNLLRLSKFETLAFVNVGNNKSLLIKFNETDESHEKLLEISNANVSDVKNFSFGDKNGFVFLKKKFNQSEFILSAVSYFEGKVQVYDICSLEIFDNRILEVVCEENFFSIYVIAGNELFRFDVNFENLLEYKKVKLFNKQNQNDFFKQNYKSIEYLVKKCEDGVFVLAGALDSNEVKHFFLIRDFEKTEIVKIRDRFENDSKFLLNISDKNLFIYIYGKKYSDTNNFSSADEKNSFVYSSLLTDDGKFEIIEYQNEFKSRNFLSGEPEDFYVFEVDGNALFCVLFKDLDESNYIYFENENFKKSFFDIKSYYFYQQFEDCLEFITVDKNSCVNYFCIIFENNSFVFKKNFLSDESDFLGTSYDDKFALYFLGSGNGKIDIYETEYGNCKLIDSEFCYFRSNNQDYINSIFQESLFKKEFIFSSGKKVILNFENNLYLYSSVNKEFKEISDVRNWIQSDFKWGRSVILVFRKNEILFFAVEL